MKYRRRGGDAQHPLGKPHGIGTCVIVLLINIGQLTAIAVLYLGEINLVMNPYLQ